MIDELFITAAATAGYLYIGTHIAPTHKLPTAIVLSVLYIVFAVVALSLLISKYGDVIIGGDASYSYWGIAVAAGTCIAYCASMSKKSSKKASIR